MNNKKIIIGIILVFLLIATIGLTYAFFSATITGEGTNQVVETGTLSLVYKDGQEIKLENALPGEQITKKITITNTGTLMANYTITLDELINTITNDELVISATCESYSDYKNLIESDICFAVEEVPIIKSDEKTSTDIETGISIKPGYTHEYTITIKFKEKNDSQNYNQGKLFFGKIKISEEVSTFSIYGSVKDQDGDPLANTTIEIYSDPINVTSDEIGSFNIDEVKSGTHTVKVKNSSGEYLGEKSIILNPKNNKIELIINTHDNNTLTLKTNEIIPLEKAILRDNIIYPDNEQSPYVTSSTGINFAQISSDTNGKGLYYATDLTRTQDINGDGKGEDVYYFRGAVENNYLIFANYCWRIVKINEDGSVRLRFGGTPTKNDSNLYSCPKTGDSVSIGYGAYNTSSTDNAYVGYMFGTTNATSYNATHTNKTNSNIKNIIDNWYSNNIAKTNNHSLVANAIYCNDRSMASYSEFPALYINSTTFTNSARGYAKNNTFYSATKRFVNPTFSVNANTFIANTTHTPTYVCKNKNDQFTLSVANGGISGYGNNALTYPVALLTLDELVYAGNNILRTNNSTANTSHFLYTTNWYWTMTPAMSYNASGTQYSRVYYQLGSYLDSGLPTYTTNLYILPVLSLVQNAGVTSGTGEYNNPYIIGTN